MNALVLFAKDVARVAAFYEAVLGAAVREREKSHVLLLVAGDIEIVVHGISPRVARGIEIAEPPEPRATAAFKPAFDVADLVRVRKLAAEHGGLVFPAKRGMVIRGRRTIDGLDPEGNVVQFREAAGR